MIELEVGKKYLNRRGEIIEIIKENKGPSFTWWPFLSNIGATYAKNGSYGIPGSQWDLIKEYIEPQENAEEQEIKLVVGKKYNIEGFSFNPYTFVADKRNFGYKNNDYVFVFIGKDGKFCFAGEGAIKNLTEHKEPFKKEITAWITYKEDRPPLKSNIGDALTNKFCLSGIYKEKPHDLDAGVKSIRGKFTFEELEESKTC